jgi:hypothetical protein
MADEENTQPRQARMVAVQDDNGFHVCSRFLKEYDAEGRAVFEDDGRILMSYGVYEVAIQDLESCLEFARAMRDKAIQDKQAQTSTLEPPPKDKRVKDKA